MKKSLSIIILGLLFLTACTASDPRSYSFIENPSNVHSLQRAVVSVFRRNSLTDELEGPRCTAFFISETILATANHCVETPTNEVIEIAPGISVVIPLAPTRVIGSDIPIMTRAQFETYRRTNGATIETSTTTVIASDPLHDVALLRLVDGTPSRNFLTPTSWEPRVGERVYSMGMPSNLPWILTQGIISSLDPRGIESGENIIHQASIAPGASGGPLVDNMGHVLGVNVGYFTGATHLGVAVPMMHVMNLLNTYNMTASSL